jgi:hypothetical protein
METLCRGDVKIEQSRQRKVYLFDFTGEIESLIPRRCARSVSVSVSGVLLRSRLHSSREVEIRR